MFLTPLQEVHLASVHSFALETMHEYISLCASVVKLRVILRSESEEQSTSSSSVSDAMRGIDRVRETFAALIRDFCEKK